MTILLRPVATPAPLVHVEIDVDVPTSDLGAWRMNGGSVDRIGHASARDSKGDIGVQPRARSVGPAIDLTFDRPPTGPVHVAYDVLAGDDAPDDPLGLYVVDDRFRGAGDTLLALPEAVEDATLAVTLRIDPEPLRAPSAASSLGVGTVRRTRTRPRALRYATFLAGSLGAGEFDAVEGHDEGVWLGYTAFDPRPVVAELAQVRTGFAELFKADLPYPPWTYLFLSQTRPIGSFTTTPRAASTLVQVGPSETWSAPLRLSIAQQLVRPWVGGELRIAAERGKDAEAYWFSEGVARYVATRLLARLALLSPNEWHDAITGELAVLATSPDRALGNADLAALAQKGDAIARATLAARGAVYAARESAALRGRTKGEKGIESEILALMQQARERVPGGQATQSAVTPATWVSALSKDDPDAGKNFDGVVIKGTLASLPPNALGPCFRAGTGEYVAFDAGFDVEGTKATKDGKVVGLRAGGPAAKAGLKEGDLLASMQGREGDAGVPLKLVLTRGGEKVALTYAPKGARGQGQTWTRVPGVSDDRCGDPP